MLPLDPAKRRCLRCGREFPSKHKGHRICFRCGERNTDFGADKSSYKKSSRKATGTEQRAAEQKRKDRRDERA